MQKRTFTHDKWGTIEIIVNNRAHRIIMRAKADSIRLTVPIYATTKDIENALKKHGERLRQQQSGLNIFFDTRYTIGDGSFHIGIKKYKGKEFMWVHEGRDAILMCPEECDFSNRQEWLQKAIRNEVAAEAKRRIPIRLTELANAHGMEFRRCSVRDTHSRWGSCNTQGNINLSIYLVLLPDELIDYVLLHELCHTVEMNHGERFWARLDIMCGGNAKVMRRRLKKYTPDI